MAELLKDNVETECRRSMADLGASPHTQTLQREVPNLLSWLKCFSNFTAIVCAKYPYKTKELFAYQALLISEARC